MTSDEIYTINAHAMARTMLKHLQERSDFADLDRSILYAHCLAASTVLQLGLGTALQVKRSGGPTPEIYYHLPEMIGTL
jgi:hypothetical protein